MVTARGAKLQEQEEGVKPWDLKTGKDSEG